MCLIHRFGFSGSDFYTFFTYKCNGNEQKLSDCQTNAQPTCEVGDPLSAVAVDCNTTSEDQTHHAVNAANVDIL